jgi:hypothetical protein
VAPPCIVCAIAAYRIDGIIDGGSDGVTGR